MNIRLIAVVGICFVAGTGAGTVYGMRGAAGAAAEHGAGAADSTHAEADDASHAETETHDTPAEADAQETAEPAQGAEPAHGEAVTHTEEPTQTAAVATATDVPPAATTADTVAVPGSSEGTARLARIFGAMRPEEAARLLEPLPEGDVRAVLFALSERKAAAILANFKGERAAALTRALITNGGGH